MKTKILDLSHYLFSLRIKFWESNLAEYQKFSYSQFPGSVEEFESQWAQIGRENNVILLTEAYHEFAFSKINKIPTSILNTGMVDALVINSKRDWIPQCFFRESLLRSIGALAPNLNTSGVACVTGIGSGMRCALSVLNQIGFSHFKIINDHEFDSGQLLKEIQRHFFNLDIEFISTRGLTLEENSGVVLVNTVSGDQNADLLESLSYLNFIHKGGLVVDFNSFTYDTQLTKESARVGLHTLRGAELQGFADYLLLQSILGGLSLNPSQYLLQWNEFVKIQSKV